MHNRLVIATGFIILIAYSALVTTIAISQQLTIRKMERQYTYYKVDQPFVDEAVRLWSGRAKENKRAINRTRFPVAMVIDKEICVELRLLKGSIGGNPLYCFDEASKHLTKRLDVVD